MGAPIDDLPSLSTFVLETEFFKRMGLRRDDLLNRPAQEIKDYCFYISMLQRKEQADAAKQNYQGPPPSARG